MDTSELVQDGVIEAPMKRGRKPKPVVAQASAKPIVTKWTGGFKFSVPVDQKDAYLAKARELVPEFVENTDAMAKAGKLPGSDTNVMETQLRAGRKGGSKTVTVYNKLSGGTVQFVVNGIDADALV